jgi:dihydroorotate dehydrogenase
MSWSRVGRVVLGFALGGALATAWGSTSSSADAYKRTLRPLLFRLEPEHAHDLALWALSHGLVAWWCRASSQLERSAHAATCAEQEVRRALQSTCWGKTFASPFGLAAGFDKDGVAVDALFDLGFGFVEVGSVTPRPQSGNPRPRLFRLEPDEAIINRMGFNSAGCEAVRAHLKRLRDRSHEAGQVATARNSVANTTPTQTMPGKKHLGINIGKNRETSEDDALSDYIQVLRTLGAFADYLVVNVSSPNTPGLRLLQRKERLRDLVRQLKRERDDLGPQWQRLPLLVKVAPDLSDEEIRDIAEIVVSEGVDGIVVTNTTVQRPVTLQSPVNLVQQEGGLSGTPLRDLSTYVLGRFYRYTLGKVPLIGVGGIFSGADAYAKIRAGASLVQLYTALMYEGPCLVPRLERELVQCLQRDGYRNIVEAIGADHR